MYRPAAAYSFAAPTAAASATLALGGHHRLVLALDGSRRIFDPESELGGLRRRDTVLGAGLTYRYRGPVIAELGYAFANDRANQAGLSLQRHRVSGSLAADLPWELSVAGTGALQWTRYPGGFAVSPDVLLATDDESTDSLTLSLTRRLPENLELELRAAYYAASFPANGLRFHRFTAVLAVGWEY